MGEIDFTINIDRIQLPLTSAFLTIQFVTGPSQNNLTATIQEVPGVEAAYCLSGDVDMLAYCECESVDALAEREIFYHKEKASLLLQPGRFWHRPLLEFKDGICGRVAKFRVGQDITVAGYHANNHQKTTVKSLKFGK